MTKADKSNYSKYRSNKKMNNGFLTREEFNQFCLEIQKIGESVGEFWYWNEFKVKLQYFCEL